MIKAKMSNKLVIADDGTVTETEMFRATDGCISVNGRLATAVDVSIQDIDVSIQDNRVRPKEDFRNTDKIIVNIFANGQ